MNPLLIRFQSVLTTLEAGNQARSQFKRLLVDKRNDVRIVTRRKSPEADLRLGHPKRTIGASGLAAALLVLAFVGLPELGTPEVLAKKEQVVIQVDDIPETRQIHRPPPPPRPPVPIETDDVDVPDDVTIESTDLNFDDVNLDLPPPPGAFAQTESLEGGAIEFWAAEDKPVITKQVPPSYPEVARRSGIQGTILVRVLIGTDGKVRQAEVIHGKKIFHNAALSAVQQYEFSPAKQNDKAMPVWMALPIRFRLVS